MNELLNKVIKICEPTFPTNPNAPIKLKDEEDNKYTLWKTKQNLDGTKSESKAYTYFKTLEGGGGGQVVEIGYVEEQKSFVNEKSKEINFNQRTIRTMKLSDMSNLPSGEVKTPLEAPVSSQNSQNNNRPSFLKQENTYNQDKPDWDTINDKKRKDIAEMNAKNNATLLLAHGQIEKEEWEEWCQKVFNYNVE